MSRIGISIHKHPALYEGKPARFLSDAPGGLAVNRNATG